MGRMEVEHEPAALLTLKEAAKRFPSPRSKGGHVSLPSLSRWCRSGIAGPHGRRVVLRSVRVGGQRYVCGQTAIEEFLQALQDVPGARLRKPDAERPRSGPEGGRARRTQGRAGARGRSEGEPLTVGDAMKSAKVLAAIGEILEELWSDPRLSDENRERIERLEVLVSKLGTKRTPRAGGSRATPKGDRS